MSSFTRLNVQFSIHVTALFHVNINCARSLFITERIPLELDKGSFLFLCYDITFLKRVIISAAENKILSWFEGRIEFIQ